MKPTELEYKQLLEKAIRIWSAGDNMSKANLVDIIRYTETSGDW